jgi:hypothetical protein
LNPIANTEHRKDQGEADCLLDVPRNCESNYSKDDAAENKCGREDWLTCLSGRSLEVKEDIEHRHRMPALGRGAMNRPPRRVISARQHMQFQGVERGSGFKVEDSVVHKIVARLPMA